MKAFYLLLAVVMTGAAVAQNTPPPPAPEQQAPVWKIAPGEPGIAVFRARMMDMREPVKGAPYTATAVTESTQVLADGNHIVNKSSAMVARDSEGRTRHELALNRIGPLRVKEPNIVFIHDPVAHTDYILNPDRQVARVLKPEGTHKARRMERRMERSMRMKMRQDMLESAQTSGEGPLQAQVKRESLGTKEIEGVAAEGTRITRTIPAGAVGNEKPIVITVERWTSPDLHVLVMSKRNDPRFGETDYQLTNITRGEPDASLFQVPSDYKTKEGRTRVFMMQKAPPPQK